MCPTSDVSTPISDDACVPSCSSTGSASASTGMVGDHADQDRGDDGWLNRDIHFPHCEKLKLRVRRGSHAKLDTMYLNVWRDGERDGQWGSAIFICSGGNVAYEWTVQDYPIDMTGIPPGERRHRSGDRTRGESGPATASMDALDVERTGRRAPTCAQHSVRQTAIEQCLVQGIPS